MDVEACLGDIDLFAALPARARARLAAVASLHRWPAGETSNALETGEAILFLISGQLRISAAEDGRIAFADVGPGETYGLTEAAAGAPIGPRAALALQDSIALLVSSAPAMAALGVCAPASLALARRLALTLLQSAAAAPEPLQRVFRDILNVARPAGETRWTVDPLPRHRELAARCGVSEEDAAAAIAHLVRLGVARRRYPALDIEDLGALRRLSA